jgi:hypothetical protein
MNGKPRHASVDKHRPNAFSLVLGLSQVRRERGTYGQARPATAASHSFFFMGAPQFVQAERIHNGTLAEGIKTHQQRSEKSGGRRPELGCG